MFEENWYMFFVKFSKTAVASSGPRRKKKTDRHLKVDPKSLYVESLFTVTQAIHMHIASTGPFITQSWSCVHAHILANDLSTIQSGVVVMYAAIDFIKFIGRNILFTFKGTIMFSTYNKNFYICKSYIFIIIFQPSFCRAL